MNKVVGVWKKYIFIVGTCSYDVMSGKGLGAPFSHLAMGIILAGHC